MLEVSVTHMLFPLRDFEILSGSEHRCTELDHAVLLKTDFVTAACTRPAEYYLCRVTRTCNSSKSLLVVKFRV